ncbi:MAG TPA: chemotaxis protein CheB, partial [Candidatus Melainabacteria bacterium]|nr:chemotaxis protein CheB [Candidatus Melainabacteria bacterium]
MPGKKSDDNRHRRGKRGSTKGADSSESTESGNRISKNSIDFPVVGIVASAGGLEAFKKFFSHIPDNCGIAFVLVPHLDPMHESLMAELIGRHTTVKVVEASHGVRVKPNYAYVIPPNNYMTISNDSLSLKGPVDQFQAQTSIDLFLRSLAEAKQEKAICIILSGTGTQGTLGLKAIKSCGGMAMVQEPTTAEYPAMPKSAIDTGMADFVMPAEELPEALIKYIKSSYVAGPRIDDGD